MSASKARSTKTTLRPDGVAAVPGQIADQGADFVSAVVTGRYRLSTRGRTARAVLFNWSEQQYIHLHDFDARSFTVGYEMAHELDGVRTMIRPSFRHMYVNDRSYVSGFTLPISVMKRTSKNVAWDFNTVFSAEKYHFATNLFENLDGPTFHADFGPRIRSRDGKYTLRAALTFDANQAKGPSVRYTTPGASLGLDTRIGRGYDLSLGYVVRKPHYRNFNARDLAFPQRPRRDDTEVTSLSVGRRIGNNRYVKLFVSHIHNSSNIQNFYEYSQDVVSASYSFPF